MRITVFTPTYNRAYCLPRLFESLKAQTFMDFEWVIIDDGSTDNTFDVVNGFISENPFFEIKYEKTENGGKHRAINCGVKKAEGDLFFIVDSDDYLPNGSLVQIDSVEKSIPLEEKVRFAGVCGLKCDVNNIIVGKTFEGKYIDIVSSVKHKYNISGDRAEVYYLDVLKKYPFPEIDGEFFLTENIVWDRIANDGLLLRYFNAKIYICDYLKDGFTHQGWALYAKNPVQWGLSIAQQRDFRILSKYTLSIQYYQYYVYEKKEFKISEMAEMLGASYLSFVILVSFQKLLNVIRRVMRRNTLNAIDA